MKNKDKTAGFTLLEVIVSLVIVTTALTAIVSVGSSRAETLLELRERHWALMVANNVLEQYYIEPAPLGVIDGQQTNGGYDWKWQLNVEQTNNENIYRLDVKVSKNNDFDYALAQLTGFKWR